MAIHVEDAAVHSPIQLQVETAPDRLDRYLADHLPELTRSRIQKLIEQEQVQVNGVICASKKASLRIGDRISLTIPEIIPLDIQAEDIPLDILYEDDHLIILNKPVGLVVHPAPGHEDGTLVNALLAHCGGNLAGIGGVQRPGIVHRLDKDTSGAIAIAKTDQVHQHLQAQFKTKTARREYLGIVYGAPQPSGTIDAPIGRKESDRKRMAIVPEDRGGRKAITHWQVEERLENYSLVRFQLETGRTHQIRVHSAHIGHPVVGDPVYSLGKSIGVNLPGQALHAWKLTLQHPVTEAWIEAIAPIPPVFTKLLTVLRNRATH